ncbi:MAG TPA: hypothetical protein DCG12_22000 [Planctomycetaceae bacterium]|nr:hypothetical protein [Planctomycetaceae bacterium]
MEPGAVALDEETVKVRDRSRAPGMLAVQLQGHLLTAMVPKQTIRGRRNRLPLIVCDNVDRMSAIIYSETDVGIPI